MDVGLCGAHPLLIGPGDEPAPTIPVIIEPNRHPDWIIQGWASRVELGITSASTKSDNHDIGC